MDKPTEKQLNFIRKTLKESNASVGEIEYVLGQIKTKLGATSWIGDYIRNKNKEFEYKASIEQPTEKQLNFIRKTLKESNASVGEIEYVLGQIKTKLDATSWIGDYIRNKNKEFEYKASIEQPTEKQLNFIRKTLDSEGMKDFDIEDFLLKNIKSKLVASNWISSRINNKK